MALTIRAAQPGDIESIYQFVCELQNRVFDKASIAEIYAVNLADPMNIYLVAEASNQKIGYASCHLQWLLHHEGKVAEIQEMFVLPEWRSQGVGKMLIESIKQKAKELGAVQLEVTTRLIREKAINFYKREHFEDSHKKLVFHLKN